MKKNLHTIALGKNLWLTGLFLCLSTLAGFTQVHFYVAATGNNANDGLSLATPKQTIPAAVTASANGDVIHIANGVYTLTATLNLNKELTIIGETEAGVIINCTGTPASAWAINPNKSNTSLSNFTIIPNGTTGGFPIHVASNTTPVPVISNISISYITIIGAKKTAFDFNGVDNLTVSYVTAKNTSAGNAVQFSGCKNVQAHHITSSGNVWGGIAVYVSKPSPSGVGRGSDNVMIDITNSSIAETNPVYVQDEAGFVNTNTSVLGLDYLVRNSSVTGYAFYYADKATALSVAAFLPSATVHSPELSTIRQVSTGKMIIGAGMKVQTAINAATANGIILVEPGVYHEDVTINKTLTIQGSGIDVTTVSGVSGGGSAAFQISANGVVIDGFTITRDGNTVTNWNDPLNTAGIAIQTVGNAEISNCKFIGNRTAIDVNNSNGNNIHNNIITDNRTGILFRNQTDQTTVTENTITNNWTMGILFISGGSGTQSAANSTFSNNNISGNWYGQVIDRQSGGTIPAPGSNLKNFTCNWFGSVTPVVSTNDSGEPGYAAQIPVMYGGTAVAPVGKPDIAGPASANFVYTPYLVSGTDSDPVKNGFQPLANSCQSPLANVQITNTTHVLCFGTNTGSVTISYSNGIGLVSYSLDGAPAQPAGASPFTLNGIATGQHTIIISDNAGASVNLTFTINGPSAALNANFTFTPITCFGGMSTQNITITGGTAPYNVINQGGGAFVLGAQEGVTYGGTEPNTFAANYTYTVTDAMGCVFTFNANITQPPVLTVAATVTNISCNANATVTISANGGKAPYTGTGVFSVAAGTYTYTVTDANGCTASTTVTPAVIPDTEQPNVVAPGAYSVPNTPGQCGATLTSIGIPFTSDNCGIASITNDHPSTYYPIGTTIVRWIVKDVSGNVNDTATQSITVIDNDLPAITVSVPDQTFCTSTTGNYTIPVLVASDNCGAVMVSYSITGATVRSNALSNNASGLFNPGVSYIKWTVTDGSGYTINATTKVTITSYPAVTIAASHADAFCNSVTLTASSAGVGSTYSWSTGSSNQSISLGQTSGDGVYSVTVTSNGCSSAPASYTFTKQTLVSSYTLLAFDEITLGENNKVNSGSVGVTSLKGEVSFRKNSSVSSPGSFVKAKKIDKNGSNIVISNPIYSAATGIALPTMLLNTASTHNLPNKDVSQNSVTTVNGNYKNLTLKKGSRTTVTGTVFGSIKVEQGAQVTFTAATISIDKLEVVKGPRYGYSYVRFAGDTKLLVSSSVSIGSQVYINPDNYKVTFYLGDKKSDDERFSVKGGDTKVTANIYVPNGKLKVTGGYSYGDYGNGRGDCDRDDDDDRYYGQGNSYVNMTGLFIADEIEGNGRNVIWNSFVCGSAAVPVLNATQVITQTLSEEKGTISTEAELKVTVLPNPSTTYFTLKLESRYNTAVNMRVTDSHGRVVDAKTGIGANSTLQVGHSYAAGIYFAEMIQGGVRKTVQLIKLR